MTIGLYTVFTICPLVPQIVLVCPPQSQELTVWAPPAASLASGFLLSSFAGVQAGGGRPGGK